MSDLITSDSQFAKTAIINAVNATYFGTGQFETGYQHLCNGADH